MALSSFIEINTGKDQGSASPKLILMFKNSDVKVEFFTLGGDVGVEAGAEGA
ncbi:hypothetical protein GCM10007158_15890 [Vreelandella hamiltonii]|uniref:Uncharacterized protein n=1 Tax=Halomonas johnsoniae TaxID=502832 RepID=A0ABQ2WHK7_9GAMM|nr:hypothetical protein GCM10007158_15890 [Halomonas johnsoniae]